MKHMKRKKDLELLNKALNLHYVDWIECYKLADRCTNPDIKARIEDRAKMLNHHEEAAAGLL